MMYWMNKENGYLVEESKLYADAEEMGYDDITDPCSACYLDYTEHYVKTNYMVK